MRGNSKKRDTPPGVTFVPTLPNSLLKRHEDADGWIQRINQHISEFNQWVSHFPPDYEWHFRTSEAFGAEYRQLAAAGATVGTLNRLYWLDTLQNCQAYTFMTVWRTVELSRSAVQAIRKNECVVAAIVARAALEGVAQYLDTARTLTATLEQVSPDDLYRQAVASEELERYLVKTIFSSRLPESEDFYSPTNILTILTRISRIEGQERLLEHYSNLCEVAHPNFFGRSVFLTDVRPGVRDGDEFRKISFSQGPSHIQILGRTLWVLSWALAAQVSSGNLMQSTITSFYEKLPPK